MLWLSPSASAVASSSWPFLFADALCVIAWQDATGALHGLLREFARNFVDPTALRVRQVGSYQEIVALMHELEYEAPRYLVTMPKVVARLRELTLGVDDYVHHGAPLERARLLLFEDLGEVAACLNGSLRNFRNMRKRMSARSKASLLNGLAGVASAGAAWDMFSPPAPIPSWGPGGGYGAPPYPVNGPPAPAPAQGGSASRGPRPARTGPPPSDEVRMVMRYLGNEYRNRATPPGSCWACLSLGKSSGSRHNARDCPNLLDPTLLMRARGARDSKDADV